MITESDIQLKDDRVAHVYDTGELDPHNFTIMWHHGSPQTGALLAPLVDAAEHRGIRLVSFGRANYGGTSALPGRDIASVAADAKQVLDALGIRHLAMMGASGGGPHALACAALLPGRVIGAAIFASVAPLGGDGLDFYSGMAGEGASLRAAEEGRDARERFEETAEFDASSFNALDYAALDDSWKSLGEDVGRSERWGTAGLIDDDLALVSPWGFDVSEVRVPTLVAQGGDDRVIPRQHGEWLAAHLPAAELWLRPRDGHISVLEAVPLAMDWLRANC